MAAIAWGCCLAVTHGPLETVTYPCLLSGEHGASQISIVKLRMTPTDDEEFYSRAVKLRFRPQELQLSVIVGS